LNTGARHFTKRRRMLRPVVSMMLRRAISVSTTSLARAFALRREFIGVTHA
jgi:hypothetical protein